MSKTTMRWLQKLEEDLTRQQSVETGVSEENRGLIERARRHMARVKELLAEGRQFTVGGGRVYFRDGTVEHLE